MESPRLDIDEEIIDGDFETNRDLYYEGCEESPLKESTVTEQPF